MIPCLLKKNKMGCILVRLVYGIMSIFMELKSTVVCGTRMDNLYHSNWIPPSSIAYL